MKKIFLFLSLFILVSLACDMSVAVNPTRPATLPTNTVILATEAPTQSQSSPTTLPPTLAPNVTVPALMGKRSLRGR